jgi:hypothetical protein
LERLAQSVRPGSGQAQRTFIWNSGAERCATEDFRICRDATRRQGIRGSARYRAIAEMQCAAKHESWFVIEEEPYAIDSAGMAYVPP